MDIELSEDEVWAGQVCRDVLVRIARIKGIDRPGHEMAAIRFCNAQLFKRVGQDDPLVKIAQRRLTRLQKDALQSLAEQLQVTIGEEVAARSAGLNQSGSLPEFEIKLTHEVIKQLISAHALCEQRERKGWKTFGHVVAAVAVAGGASVILTYWYRKSRLKSKHP